VDDSVHLLRPPLFIEIEMSIGGFPIDGYFLSGVKRAWSSKQNPLVGEWILTLVPVTKGILNDLEKEIITFIRKHSLGNPYRIIWLNELSDDELSKFRSDVIDKIDADYLTKE